MWSTRTSPPLRMWRLVPREATGGLPTTWIPHRRYPSSRPGWRPSPERWLKSWKAANLWPIMRQLSSLSISTLKSRMTQAMKTMTATRTILRIKMVAQTETRRATSTQPPWRSATLRPAAKRCGTKTRGPRGRIICVAESMMPGMCWRQLTS